MAAPPDPLTQATGFDWDAGNLDKNWTRHGVRWSECEEVFSHRPVLLRSDERHSYGEVRNAVWGRTASGRRLTVVFTMRGSLIRVISARDMNRSEARRYDHAAEAQTDTDV